MGGPGGRVHDRRTGPYPQFLSGLFCDLGKHFPGPSAWTLVWGADLLLGLESGGACGTPNRVRRVRLSSEAEDLGAGEVECAGDQVPPGLGATGPGGTIRSWSQARGTQGPSQRRQPFPAVSRVPAA